MANSVSHAALPFPVKNARFTIEVPYLDADGDPTDPTTPDTEVSKDGGSFADCVEEVTTINGSNGMGYITLTGAEMNASLVAVCAKVASGPKATLASMHPRVLPVLFTGTAQAGANGSITLASGAPAFSLIGCIVRTTGGTGGGGTGGASNQARVITAYDNSTKVASVVPDWETNPSSDTTYDILLTEMWDPSGRAAWLNWEELAANHTTSGSFGKYLDAQISTWFTKLKKYFQLLVRKDSAIATDNATELTELNASGGSGSGTFNNTTDAVEALRDRGDAAWITATGFSTLDAAGVRTAVGLGSANLDTQLSAIAGYIDTEVSGIKSVTDRLETNLTNTRIGNLDHLDADISSVSGGGSAPSAADIRAEMDSNSTKLALLANVTYGLSALKTLIDTLATAAKLKKYFQLLVRKDSAIATDNATELTELNASGGSGSGTFNNTTDAVEALRDRGDAAWITATGFSTLDAAGVRTAVGLGSANLDTQLSAIAGYIDTEVADIKAKTDLIGTAAVLADGGITKAKFANNAIDSDVLATDAFGSLELAASAATEIATAVAAAVSTAQIQCRVGISIADDGTCTISGHLEANGADVALASGSMTVVCTEDSTGTPVATFSDSTGTVIDGYRFSLQQEMSGLVAGQLYVFKVTITDADSVDHTTTFEYGVH